MPDTEEKTVDIDTTGPGAEVDIEEEKKEVETVEPVVEEKKEAVEEKQESGDKQQEEKPKEEKQQQQPTEPGKLSPQQVKNLLEAMNNEEKKVQDKINAKKQKGTKVKSEKDW